MKDKITNNKKDIFSTRSYCISDYSFGCGNYFDYSA